MTRLLRYGVLILLFVSVPAVGLAAEGCNAVYGSGPNEFTVATGSPGQLGLLEALANAFTPGAQATMCWKAAGSGKSLKLLKAGEVDAVMVHAPAAEKAAVEQGWAVKRTLIGSNEFYIVGPPEDPAGVSQAKSAADAYAMVAAARAPFISRGDNSGTHKKEMAIWEQAGVTPSGDWYIVTNDFMIGSLKRANSEDGYFMSDSSTWVQEKNNVPKLKLLFRGDKFLVNVYHALCQPENATPGAALGSKFVDFLASEEGTEIIREFGREEFGEPLYNDASYARQYEH